MYIFLFLFIMRVEAKINPFGPTVVSDFTNCVSELMDTNFNDSGLIIFANTKNISTVVANIRAHLLESIHSDIKFSVQIKSPRNDPAICDGASDDDEYSVVHMEQFQAIIIADYFIVIIDSYKDFTQVASRIIRSRNWNPHAKFIIVLFNFANIDEDNVPFVENILTCMYRHNVINIVVLVPQANNIRNSIIYSWRPFDPPKYCGYFNETAKDRLLIENICERGFMNHRKDIFGDRIPDSMQGCVLHILALERQPFVSADVDDPNIERLFINQLAEKYDFKTEYKIVNGFRGERNDTGDWDGALKGLAAKNGSILLGGIFPDFDVHEDFECSNTYLADSYTWVSPRALESPKWISLFIIFQHSVWYSTMGGFCICVLSWNILGHLSGDSLYHKVFGHCFMNTWISHVGFCAYARPVKDSLRIFYVFFNMYCILFLTGYQTKLIDVLTNPSFEEQIDTIEELVESGLKFGGFEELHDLFYNSSDPFDYFLGEEWIDVDNITQAMIDVSVHRNFSVLCSRLELAHLSATLPQLSDASGNFKYFVFERNMFTVPMEMVALRGFAFMRHFSRMLERFKQLGVNSGVRRHFAHLNLRRRAKLLRALEEQSDVSPLTLQHLQGGFLALAMGYTSGTLVLLIEIIVSTKYVQQKVLEFKKCLRTRTRGI